MVHYLQSVTLELLYNIVSGWIVHRSPVIHHHHHHHHLSCVAGSRSHTGGEDGERWRVKRERVQGCSVEAFFIYFAKFTAPESQKPAAGSHREAEDALQNTLWLLHTQSSGFTQLQSTSHWFSLAN